jgi:hypothetical protein
MYPPYTVPGWSWYGSHGIYPWNETSNANISAAISQAGTMIGQRPYIYFTQGVYPVNQTIVVPPYLDCQFVGAESLDVDSNNWQQFHARIYWNGSYNGQMFLVQGPSKVCRSHHIHSCSYSL